MNIWLSLQEDIFKVYMLLVEGKLTLPGFQIQFWLLADQCTLV